MKLVVQPSLPGTEPTHVTARVYVHHSADGRWSVGVDVRDPETGEQLAGGASRSLTAQEAEAESLDLLRQCLRVLPTLVDSPPFL